LSKAARDISVLHGAPLASGWTGKLWALSQGIAQAGTPRFLWLTDADIEHAPDTLRRLVGIGSVAGIRGLPGAGAYSASKAAVLCYCESLRLELKPFGIKVVTIAPGYIATPMTEKNAYPMPFLMPAARFAQKAVRAIAAGDSYRVIPWQMGVVAKLLRALPNFLYDLAFAKAPHKARKST
jgi:short-subunit dehydrogenase